ncbi:MAG: ABC transporter permease, partial [Anaerotignum sp.]|nr:ABC transporter permease [Anaerotignum sp.]
MYSSENISREQKEFLVKIRNRKRLIHLVQILLLVFFFLLWETAAKKGWIDPFIFSQPSKLIGAAKEMISDG